MKLVEVVKTISTDDDVYEQAVEFGKNFQTSWDKTG